MPSPIAFPKSLRGGSDARLLSIALDENFRYLQLWINKFIVTGIAVDHGGLVGLADDDHTTYVLADGTRDITGTQRFTALIAALYGGANDAQMQFREDGDSWRVEIGDNANTFVTRMRLFTDDHTSQAGDFDIRDGDGITSRLLFDQSATQWRLNATVRPETTSAIDMGAVGKVFRDLYVDTVIDRAGVTTYDIENAEFDTAHTFLATTRFAAAIPAKFGAAGDAQLAFSIVVVDAMSINVGNDAGVFTERIRLFSADHATTAHDFAFLKSTGANSLLWDNSLDAWRMFVNFRTRTILPESDVTYTLGDPAGSTWLSLSVDEIIDRAGVTTYDVENATFDIAHLFTAQVRFTAAIPTIWGAAGDAQLELLEGPDDWSIAVGNNANSFTSRITFRTSDAADAHDVRFLNGAAGLAMLWDNSLNIFRMFTDFRVRNAVPEADNLYSSGSASLTWKDGFFYNIKDEAGNVVLDTSAAGVAYTLNATAVPDRTLLASASATTLNNNNVLAALITDLKLIGLIS